MDPNETLKEIRELVSRMLNSTGGDPADALQLAEKVDDLDTWLTNNGTCPNDWKGANLSVVMGA